VAGGAVGAGGTAGEGDPNQIERKEGRAGDADGGGETVAVGGGAGVGRAVAAPPLTGRGWIRRASTEAAGEPAGVTGAV
jgi:hypothetical protein